MIFNFDTTTDDLLKNKNLNGLRFLITGVSSGIGLETARALVAHGAVVMGTVRDLRKSEASIEMIKSAAEAGGGKFESIDLNLASLKSVYACADSLLSQGHQFDVIINNAGVMATPLGYTEDGFETQLATNHLGHFALLSRIEPLLKDNGRLIVLSSQAHRVANVDLQDPNFKNQDYDAFVAYGRSKTANILFAVEFDKRFKTRGVRAAAVMPGNSITNLPRHFSEEQLQGLFQTVNNARAEAGLGPTQLKDIDQAAATSVWAAVVADKDEIGGRYLEDCAVAEIDDTPNPFLEGVMSYALDSEAAQKLWQTSESLINVD